MTLPATEIKDPGLSFDLKQIHDLINFVRRARLSLLVEQDRRKEFPKRVLAAP